jgi:3-phosphoshikimate 1-carboxyvinyltransferase
MKRVDLTKFIPPDKSSLIRQLLFSLLTVEEVQIKKVRNFPLDIATALKILPVFGKKIRETRSKIEITGPAQKPASVINCENSGTVLHLLMGICVLKGWKTTFTGDSSLMGRDHTPFFDAAFLYGSEVIVADRTVTLIPSPDIPHIKTELSKQSAQLKGFHILCMLKSGGELKYDADTRKNSEHILGIMGVKLKESEKKIKVYPAGQLSGYSLPAHRDPSSAFIAACASIISEVKFKISGIYPERLRLSPFEFLANTGLNISIEEVNKTFTVKDIGKSIFVAGSSDLINDRIPSFIDEIPFMAYMAAREGKSFILADGSWLRNKESDRVKASVDLIGRVYESFQTEKGFAIMSEEKKSFVSEMPHSDDHRMEMLAALIALDRNIPFEAGNSVSVSFPMFPEMIKTLRANCEKNIAREIESTRKKIDRIDDKIVKLLSERAELAREVIEIKKASGIKISDPERENKIITRLSGHDSSISDLVGDLYRRIFDWIKRR